MTARRSCWIWCLVLVFATNPLHAEDHDQQQSSLPHGIADGTTFLIRLEETLDVSRVRPGKRFKAKLEEDMMGSDETRILHGARIKGHISAVGSGFHPRLLLSFDEIETQRGWTPLIATITAVPGEHGLEIGDEGAIERQGSSQHHGADSDGTSSGAGTAAAVMRTLFSDHRLQLHKGTILEVRLDRPLRVPWR